MKQKSTEKLIHYFLSGLTSDSEAAQSWVFNAIIAPNIDANMMDFRSLPTSIRLATFHLIYQIQQNNFKWSPFLIGTKQREEIVFNAMQRSLCQAILKECNSGPLGTA